MLRVAFDSMNPIRRNALYPRAIRIKLLRELTRAVS